MTLLFFSALIRCQPAEFSFLCGDVRAQSPFDLVALDAPLQLLLFGRQRALGALDIGPGAVDKRDLLRDARTAPVRELLRGCCSIATTNSPRSPAFLPSLYEAETGAFRRPW